MKIHIEDNSSTELIKEKFSKAYPFLKLEFFSSGHKEKENSKKEDLITSDSLLKDIRSKHNEGDFIITPQSKVSEVEQGFESKFGIYVQVYRKSRNLWLETTSTDRWTLIEQNKVGMDMES